MMNDVDLQKWLIQAVRISLLCEKCVEYYYYNTEKCVKYSAFQISDAWLENDDLNDISNAMKCEIYTYLQQSTDVQILLLYFCKK